MPIGNLTSQSFANLYLDGFDHFVTEVLRAPYVRYVDDFALFHDDPAVLGEWRNRIERYLEGRRLRLVPLDVHRAQLQCRLRFSVSSFTPMAGAACPPITCAGSATACVDFATAGGLGRIEFNEVELGCAPGWHAGNAQTWRLRYAIFRGGGSIRAYPEGLDGPLSACRSRRLLCRTHVSSVTNNTPENSRSASRNRNTPDNRNNNIGFRVGSTLSARAGATKVSPGEHLSVQGRP